MDVARSEDDPERFRREVMWYADDADELGEWPTTPQCATRGGAQMERCPNEAEFRLTRIGSEPDNNDPVVCAPCLVVWVRQRGGGIVTRIRRPEPQQHPVPRPGKARFGGAAP